jgi:hypothetical protein
VGAGGGASGADNGEAGGAGGDGGTAEEAVVPAEDATGAGGVTPAEAPALALGAGGETGDFGWGAALAAPEG